MPTRQNWAWFGVLIINYLVNKPAFESNSDHLLNPVRSAQSPSEFLEDAVKRYTCWTTLDS